MKLPVKPLGHKKADCPLFYPDVDFICSFVFLCTENFAVDMIFKRLFTGYGQAFDFIVFDYSFFFSGKS